MIFPFEVSFADIEADPDPFISAVFSSLETEFLVMPKGEGFIDYSTFEQGYECLKRATAGFRDVSPEPIWQAALQTPMVLIVLRATLGFTPSE